MSPAWECWSRFLTGLPDSRWFSYHPFILHMPLEPTACNMDPTMSFLCLLSFSSDLFLGNSPPSMFGRPLLPYLPHLTLWPHPYSQWTICHPQALPYAYTHCPFHLLTKRAHLSKTHSKATSAVKLSLSPEAWYFPALCPHSSVHITSRSFPPCCP